MKRHLLPVVLRHYLAAQWRWHTLRGERLTAFQHARARQIIGYAQQHSPFYREHWAGADPTNWRTLPTVDKERMMAHFATFNTCGIPYERAFHAAQQAERAPAIDVTMCDAAGHQLTAGLSSGTSGARGLFLITEQEIAMWAGVILARALHGLPRYQRRVAFFLRAFSSLYAGVNSPLLQLRYFALTQPLDEVIAALNDYQPHIIVGPPSLLGALAAQRNAGHLAVSPERLITVAEVLERQDTTQLEAAFAVPIHQIYQCTEGLLAISCRHGALHVQEDLVALQLESLLTLPGEPQRYTPIVTDLWRTTQPIIRYRLGDIVQLEEQPCRCGSAFRVLRAVEGRVADICYFSTLDGQRLPFYPAQLSRIIRASIPPQVDYQLIQRQDDQLDIYLSTADATDYQGIAERVQATMRCLLMGHGCCAPQLQCHPGLPRRLPTTKRRRVQREATR